MRIVGHGVDIVDSNRIARMLETHSDRFLTRCYTEAERAYCQANPARQLEHLAGRFAAKEAILKVLGTGWSGGIAWTDAEIVRSASGMPGVVLHGRCIDVAQRLGITDWWLSISHIRTHSIASAIAAAALP